MKNLRFLVAVARLTMATVGVVAGASAAQAYIVDFDNVASGGAQTARRRPASLSKMLTTFPTWMLSAILF